MKEGLELAQFLPLLILTAIYGFIFVMIKRIFIGIRTCRSRTVSELKYEISELRGTIEKLSERIEELERGI